MGLMTNRDFQNYSSLFQLMESLVEAPDLLFIYEARFLIWWHRFTNAVAIMKLYSIEYLSRLNERYEAGLQHTQKEIY
jgi:hypothetical protein